MEIRNKLNGGVVGVSDEYAERLIASGEYEALEKPKKAPARKPKQGAKED